MAEIKASGGSDLMRSAPTYFIFYLVPMALTYTLPYFGSNSSLLNLLTFGFNPAFWLHVCAYLALIWIASLRGKLIQYESLVMFPIMAFLFDFAPILNWIPFVPSVFHLGAITVGVLSETKRA